MSLSLNKIFAHAGRDLLIRELTLDSRNVRAGDLFLPPARRVVARECTTRNRECRIVASGLGDAAGDVAALCAAIYPGRLGEADR